MAEDTRIPRPLLLALVLAGAGLADVLLSLAPIHAAVFDHVFGVLVWALAGCGLVVGVGLAAADTVRGEAGDWLLASAVAAMLAVNMPFVLPLDSLVAYLAVAGAAMLPFACAAAAMQRLWRQVASGLPFMLVLCLAGAMLSWPWQMQVLGDELRVACAGSLALAVSALLVVRGKRLLIAGGVVLMAAGAAGYVLHALGPTPSPKWLPESSYTFRAPAAAIGARAESPTTAHDRAWFEARFPLLALALSAREPQRVLVVGSATGIETQMMRAFAAPSVEAFAWDGTAGSVADMRAKLRGQAGTADLLLLTGTQGSPNNRWVGADPRADYLWTGEAFEIYWRALSPGGVLVVILQDEAVFTRAVLTVRETIAMSSERSGARVWGLRLLPMGDAQGAYRHLLLVGKPPAPDALERRVIELAGKMPVISLFGPGLGVFQYYAALYDPRGPEVARAVFTEVMSYRARTRAEILPVSDLRPFAFHIVREVHPFLRTLLGVGVLSLIAILLLPMPQSRAPGSVRVPLPAFLGFYVLMGLDVAALFVALTQQSAPLLVAWSGSTGAVGLALAAGLVAGYAVSQRALRDVPVHGAVAALAVPPLAGWLLFSAFLPAVFGWPQAVAALLAVVLALAGGFLLSFVAQRAGTHLRRELPGLLPWAGVVASVAALVGAIAVNWLARLHGWDSVWLLATYVTVAASAVAWWLWREGATGISMARGG